MSSLKVKIKIHTGDIEKGLEDFGNTFKEITTNTMQQNVDSAFDYSWLEQGGLLESPFSHTGLGASQTTSKLMTQQIQSMYAEAWEKKYKSLQDAYRSAMGGKGQGWIDWKKSRSGEESPWVRKPILSSATWGLMTGYLRDSISDAFSSGKDKKFIKFDNLGLRGVWNVDLNESAWDLAKTNYIEEITKKYVNDIQALGHERELTEISLEDLKEIGGEMLKTINTAFVVPLVRDLNEMLIEIPVEGGKGEK